MSGYTHSEPFDVGLLPVGAIHRIYYEQYGRKDGKPVIFLHGGPGGCTSRSNTTYFDPAVYRVILLDQRGTGKSEPTTELIENTTPHLVSDIDALRQHLAISKWHLIFAYPQFVRSMILRGIFTASRLEVAWSRSSLGAANVYPEAWHVFQRYLPEDDRHDMIAGYYKRLTCDHHPTRLAAAKEWNRWDLSIGELKVDEDGFKKLDDYEWSWAHALLEAHYAVHGFWLEDRQIFKPKNLAKIRHIPVTIIQGRYDMVCPPQTAWELHRCLPMSRLIWIPDAGHSGREPGTRLELLRACDENAGLDFDAHD
ncbi:proline iminopeptidase [Penicillium cosmopolitanum]|uniref:Proline iminopeptidase n=1 Tax=Penicillium cosmopolitanum TaxID=1131564 RepID=A0A9W9VS31_9EURO|nr:proline iminopeptidase [Penicillium cosmopolitanum]KAJ5388362.1 proline iminopeptidase [Penicillium cosmopolitanum]